LAVTAIRAALEDVDGGVEIVVVDDGSADATAEAARTAGADRVIVHATNRGKGAAVRTGMLAADGRAVAFTDADLAYAPEQLKGLLDVVESGIDVVVGSRMHADTRTLVHARRLREIGGRVINALTRLVVVGDYRDTQCGLKAFGADAAKLIFDRSRINGFAFDVEVFVIAEHRGLSVKEVPVTVVNTTRSTVHILRDAVRLVVDLFRIRRWSRRGLYE
jgi:dolichyl-phosphate beta-glucosyltransferase